MVEYKFLYFYHDYIRFVKTIMTLFQNKYRIETTRLQGYDYSQPGGYFISLVTFNRACLFGIKKGCSFWEQPFLLYKRNIKNVF